MGCDQDVILKRVRRSKKISRLIDFYRGRARDIAEVKRQLAVNEGESWAVKLALEEPRPEPIDDQRDVLHPRRGASVPELIRALHAEAEFHEYSQWLAEKGDESSRGPTTKPA